MPFNGNGVFNRLYSWVQDAVNAIPITASRMDPDSNDIAAGLTNCVTRDGQSPAMANLPMGGFRHINVANAVNPNEYIAFGQAEARYFPIAGGTFTNPVIFNGGITTNVLVSTGAITGTGITGTSLISSGGLGSATSVTVANTSAGGRSWSVFTAGSSGVLPAGNFGVFDNTAGFTRMSIDNSGTCTHFGPLTVSMNSANSTPMTLTNTASGAHSYTLASSGGGPAPTGSFVLFDNSVGTNRMVMDGSGNTTFNVSLSSPLIIQTSDARLKDVIGEFAPRDLTGIRIAEYTWKDGGKYAVSPIAQEVAELAPEYVHEGTDGVLGVDKAGLALERVAFLEGVLRKAGML